ncbi:hypothetical protein G7Y79_00026g058630 [Physcia stellaris]|nr:hypothetical protein G7Y79_00026g058630 [Physcia stellaris]
MIIRASGCTCTLIYNPCNNNLYEDAVKICREPSGGILIQSNCGLAFEYTSQGSPNPAWDPPRRFNHIMSMSSRKELSEEEEEGHKENNAERSAFDISSDDDQPTDYCRHTRVLIVQARGLPRPRVQLRDSHLITSSLAAVAAL